MGTKQEKKRKKKKSNPTVAFLLLPFFADSSSFPSPFASYFYSFRLLKGHSDFNGRRITFIFGDF